MLYQLGRNSNTHFFRYLLRHIERDFTLKEKRAQREERRRQHRRPGAPPANGADFSDDSDDDEEVNNVSVVGSETNGSGRRRHHKIAMSYNAA